MKKQTLVLCLTLGIFMMAGCGADDGNNNNDQNMNDGTEVIALYFGERDKHALLKEDRTVTITTAKEEDDTNGRAELLLTELINGPTESRCTPVLPEETKVNSVKVENGLARVDFSKTFTDNYNLETMEPTLTVNAILATLTRLDGVERVKITVDGQPLKLGTTTYSDALTVSASLQQQINELEKNNVSNGDTNGVNDMNGMNGTNRNGVLNDGENLVDDMVDGGRELVDDMADTGKELMDDGRDMLKDGKNAVEDGLNMNDNNRNGR